VLIARERQVELMRNSLVGVAFNVAATCAAVPIAGVHGAAVVRVATGAVVLALNYRSSVQRSLAPSFGMVVGRVPSG
jgi:O-antigen/teichoic acid export membrane protein